MSKNSFDVSVGENVVKQSDKPNTPNNNSPKMHKRDYTELKKKFFGDSSNATEKNH